MKGTANRGRARVRAGRGVVTRRPAPLAMAPADGAVARAAGSVAGVEARPALARTRGTALALVKRYWPIGIVLALYAVSAMIVPTMTSAPVSDDWVYTRSVEILVHQHQLKILDLSVVTLIFQVFWGALFAEIFGMSFGAVRLSTVALMFMAGIAVYAICRELTVSRGRSALGAASFLFNPLSFVLGFSFMSDPQFAALMTISTYFYLRGLRPDTT